MLRNFRLLSLVSVFTFLISVPAIASPITIGHARFTVIAPQVIRMEYSATNQFIDEPSLFAINRKAALTADELAALHTKVTGNTLTIDTGKMVFTYTNDEVPFHAGNPSAVVGTSQTE
jgi:hypothetical protein